jgi:oligoendopeptidase F
MGRTTVPPRNEIPPEYTWDVASVFPSDEAWETEFNRVSDQLPILERFRGRLGESPATLADWLQAEEDVLRSLGKVALYATMQHNVDTADQAAKAKQDRATGLQARVAAVTSFAEPEILVIGSDTLQRWMQEEPRLAVYAHYFDRLEARRAHVRAAEVEELLGLVRDPFATASGVHRTLADTDLTFAPARTAGGETVEVVQGNINTLLTDADRELRRTAWESYSDAHLAMKNTMATALASGVKQNVFLARARRYPSALEASLAPNHIPTSVFYNLIDTYRRNLPIWHRYWRLRRRALGYETLHVYDIKAPLTAKLVEVPYQQATEWIIQGMQPLGEEYVTALTRGLREERWVDVYPNQGKRSGAYSSGVPGTHSFILMSYSDNLFGMSTLAHELGHSMHSTFTRRTQPFVYARYGLFLAETASNFNQALVRAYLLDTNGDPDFQIAVIEEAMSNFHRYFFIMPALARFELEIHQRVERGEGLTADGLIELMSELFQEGYGDEVELDRDRIGITWAQFPGHLYANFYVYQYATGISAAHALAQRVLEGAPGAAERYLTFLKAGGSVYPLDALAQAGVDMTSPEPVEQTFGVMAQLVDRLERLLENRAAATV